MPGRRGEPPTPPPRKDPPSLGEGQRERSSGLCLSLGLAALSPPQVTHARWGQEGPLPPGLACLPLRPSSRPQGGLRAPGHGLPLSPPAHHHRAAADPADPSGLWPQREKYTPAAILAASWKLGPPSPPSGPGWIPKPQGPPIPCQLPASPWGPGTCLDPLPTPPPCLLELQDSGPLQPLSPLPRCSSRLSWAGLATACLSLRSAYQCHLLSKALPDSLI